jgi:D-alanyl-D-alanine carboxypeptidase (penicillin-binding protein 5/6)
MRYGAPFLDTSRRRRAQLRRRRARRRGVLLLAAVVVLIGLGILAATAGEDDADRPAARAAAEPRTTPDGAVPPDALPPAATGQTALGPLPLTVDLADTDDPVKLKFKRPPRAGLLVNLDTGEVLWRRRPDRALPIASLTKMMTALVAVDTLDPKAKARITKAVLAYSGSGVGVLPRGKRVRVQTLLYGLMLPSGNDAARALAFRAAGSLDAYVERMNEKAGAMGLRCTRFASVEGLSDENRSCPADLAVIARKVLDTPRLARIVKRRRAILPFPIEGGRIHLYNNNPLLRQGYPGIIGIKTGYTDKAGRCLVAAARRNGVRLAAIVLDSGAPGKQARQLLDRGFRAAT